MRLIGRLTAGGAFALAAVVFVGLNTATSFAAPPGKAVICHAAGGKYVGIYISVGSSGLPDTNNGHLDANGSAASGHEQDIYLGPSAEKSDCDKLTPPK
jgi:hypothetical protein